MPMPTDAILIFAIMAGLGVAMALRVRRNQRFRAKLIADFLADPERRQRQGM